MDLYVLAHGSDLRVPSRFNKHVKTGCFMCIPFFNYWSLFAFSSACAFIPVSTVRANWIQVSVVRLGPQSAF